MQGQAIVKFLLFVVGGALVACASRVSGPSSPEGECRNCRCCGGDSQVVRSIVFVDGNGMPRFRMQEDDDCLVVSDAAGAKISSFRRNASTSWLSVYDTKGKAVANLLVRSGGSEGSASLTLVGGEERGTSSVLLSAVGTLPTVVCHSSLGSTSTLSAKRLEAHGVSIVAPRGKEYCELACEPDGRGGYLRLRSRKGDDSMETTLDASSRGK